MKMTLTNGKVFDLDGFNELSDLKRTFGTGLGNDFEAFLFDVMTWFPNHLDYLFFTNKETKEYIFVFKKDVISFSSN